MYYIFPQNPFFIICEMELLGPSSKNNEKNKNINKWKNKKRVHSEKISDIFSKQTNKQTFLIFRENRTLKFREMVLPSAKIKKMLGWNFPSLKKKQNPALKKFLIFQETNCSSPKLKKRLIFPEETWKTANTKISYISLKNVLSYFDIIVSHNHWKRKKIGRVPSKKPLLWSHF